MRSTKPKTELKAIADKLCEHLISANECDRNGEPAYVVDGLFAIARGLHDVAGAIRETKPKEPR